MRIIFVFVVALLLSGCSTKFMQEYRAGLSQLLSSNTDSKIHSDNKKNFNTKTNTRLNSQNNTQNNTQRNYTNSQSTNIMPYPCKLSDDAPIDPYVDYMP